jgi:hypothetical protein
MQLREETLERGVLVPQTLGGDGTWMASLQKHHHHHNQQQQQRTSLNNVVDISTTSGDTVMQVIAVSAE